MIGRRLNHYTVLSKLGEGGMAEVYRARDNRLDRDVALKVLPDEMARDAARIERFEREAKVVAALNHPNIVTIYSVEEADGVHFFTMELVDGKSLAEIIPVDGLELGAFYRIALPLLDAVAAAHRRGITHRDIKPANVMVNSEGVVKLLDLGLAKLDPALAAADPRTAAETWTRKGRTIGTVPYMAPEQLSGGTIDHRVDIFALGVVLYEMLTCRRPFVGSTSSEVISAILEQAPKPLSEVRVDLPDAVGRVVEHCLEKEPTRRYQSARELREALTRLAERGRPGFEHSSGRETIRAGRPRLLAGRSRRWWLAGAIALGIALTVATVLVVWPASDASPAETPAGTPVLSLAVSPLTFDNRGAAPAFAHQLEREIVGRLGQIDGLELVASSGTGATIPPEADYLLWGAVNWLDADDEVPHVRASFGLLRTIDGRDIWTESFDRSTASIDRARREIALLVESRVGRLLGFSVPEVAERIPAARSAGDVTAAVGPPPRTRRSGPPAREEQRVDLPATERALETGAG
ncbi:MAG: serine/threonine-protein kinase [Thermoanaerobaculia bacterium]|nr:serine/threonine-protein kinase [Thermoanaerobaculia bacterium]